MNIGILGSGNIGKTAAEHFARAGHRVFLSNSQSPASLRDVVAKLGPAVEPATSADAVAKAEVVLLAVPWGKRAEAFRDAGGAGAFAGKVLVDALNPYLDYPNVEDLRGKTSSAVVAAQLPGARVVKAFNTMEPWPTGRAQVRRKGNASPCQSAETTPKPKRWFRG